MALVTRLNVSGTGGNHTTWWAIRTLLDAGWTAVQSGSGTGGTYSAVGNVFDLGVGQNPFIYSLGVASGKLASGAGTEPWCAAVRAWIVLRAPAPDGAELLIQRGTGANDAGDANWNIIEAPGGFNFAGCNANTAPAAAATPGQWYRYGDTNPDSAGAACFSSGAVNNLFSVSAENAASVPGHVGAVGRYGFCLVNFTAGNALNRMWCRDPIVPTYMDLAAPLPVRYYLGTTSHHADGAAPTLNWRRIHDFGGGGMAVVSAANCRVSTSAGTLIYPDNAGVPAAGQPDMPGIIGTLTGAAGFVGFSSMTVTAARIRAYPDNSVNRLWWYLGSDGIAVRIGDGITLPGSI